MIDWTPDDQSNSPAMFASTSGSGPSVVVGLLVGCRCGGVRWWCQFSRCDAVARGGGNTGLQYYWRVSGALTPTFRLGTIYLTPAQTAGKSTHRKNTYSGAEQTAAVVGGQREAAVIGGRCRCGGRRRSHHRDEREIDVVAHHERDEKAGPGEEVEHVAGGNAICFCSVFCFSICGEKIPRATL